MNWRTTSAYHQISDCGRYHVSRARIGERDYFDAWRGSLGTKDFQHLHGSCDKQAAIQACIDDSAQQPPRPRAA